MKKILSFIKKNNEVFIILGVLFVSIVAFSHNMFHYPYFEDDEGTYLSQAWSVLNQGKLAPYTYWYDHAPLGWLFIALWEKLTGGFFTFGFSINSGRMFMLVLHTFSVLFLYFIGKRISGSKLGASLAALIFALSPLGLSFERRVLLDNIMTFWLLLSYVLILGQNKKLKHYIFSGITFGIAVLSKESAVFFLPVYLAVLYFNANKHHRAFAITKWLATSLSIISGYFLYAVIKGEFFPSGSLLGGKLPHVSIYDTFTYQLARKGGFFLNQSSGFMQNFREWLSGGYFIPVPDPIIITGGILATFLLLLLSLKKRNLIFAVLPSIAYSFFLIRGGEVIGFYIVPLIPFFALNIGLSISTVNNLVFNKFYPKITKPLFVLLTLLPFLLIYPKITSLYTEDQTTQQIQALAWMSNNVPSNAKVMMDNYAYIEFHDKSSLNKYNKLPSQAEYYWKADKDPEIRLKAFGNNWQNVDYILATSQVTYDADHAGLKFVKDAYTNSTSVASFKGGWSIDVFKVNKGQSTILNDTWKEYKRTFISPNGQITDPSSNKTTSEGQSYALLRAVWINDKTTFDKVLTWSTSNTLLKDKNLFAWWYGKNDKGQTGIVDKGTATDADQDIAVALLFASKHWHEPKYQTLAQRIIADIWKYETVEVGGKRYVVAGNWSSEPNKTVYTINPSYLSPYAYRMFAEVDKTHDWKSVVDSSYEILDKCSVASLGKQNTTYLPPNWCNIIKDGKVVAANEMGKDSTDYSFDALRMPWRIALDYQWNKDQRALAYLKKINLFTDEWKKNGKIYTAYTHEGKNTDKSESLAQYGTQLAYFTIIDKKIADKIYDAKINSVYSHNKNEFYWGDKNNYYNQNWVWFGTALYTNNLPNLWVNRK